MTRQTLHGTAIRPSVPPTYESDDSDRTLDDSHWDGTVEFTLPMPTPIADMVALLIGVSVLDASLAYETHLVRGAE